MRRAVLWFLLLILAALICLINRMQVSADEPALCLQYDDRSTGRVSINLTTGVQQGGSVGAALDAAVQNYTNRPIVALSPDQKHTAVQYQTLDGKIIFGLLPAYTINAQLNTDTDANDGLWHSDMAWSPDSQWLSYMTLRSDGYYLSLLDTTGHVQQTRLISSRHDDSVTLFGWSGDGKYLVVSVSDSISGPLRKIEIWSTPTLEFAHLIEPAFSLVGPRLFGDWEFPDSLRNPDRIQWSGQGSVLAYLDYHDDGMSEGLTLSLYTPDDDQTITYELPDIRDPHGVSMEWSPDGQSIAVATTLKTDKTIGRIDVVRLTAAALHRVSEKALHYVIFAGGGASLPFMQWSADGHALFFVEQLPNQSRDLGALMAYLPETGQTVSVSPHIYLNPGTDATHRYLFARSPDDGQDHNLLLNPAAVKQTPTTEDTLVVVDTNSLKVQTVPALQNIANAFQVFGTYSETTGWLLLTEDALMTWAINTHTGEQVAVYPPHALYNNRGKLPLYFPIQNADFVAGLELGDSHEASAMTIRSLHDASIRTITHSFFWPMYDIALSPDGDLLAVIEEKAPGNRALEILKADGTLLWQFDHITARATNLVFANCA